MLKVMTNLGLWQGGQFFPGYFTFQDPYKSRAPPWHKNLINTYTNKTYLPVSCPFETLLESAILTLVSVVLVYGTGSVSSACIGQVPSDGSLEEGLAALAGKLSIVFSTGLVSTDNTFYLRCRNFIWTVSWAICRGYRCGGWGIWLCIFGYLSLRLWYCCHRLGCYWGWWGRLLGCCLRCLRHRGRRRWCSWSWSIGHCSVESTIVGRRTPFLQPVVGGSHDFLSPSSAGVPQEVGCLTGVFTIAISILNTYSVD